MEIHRKEHVVAAFAIATAAIQKQPPVVFLKKGVLKNFPKLTGKHQCQSLFFNRTLNIYFIKKGPWHRCFLVNFAKLLRTPFLQNTSGQLLTIIAEKIISNKNRKARGE